MNQIDLHTPDRDFKPQGLATLIGSLPVADHSKGLELIFAHTPDIPLWPQLPNNREEGMLNQFIEGLPGIVETTDRTYFDTDLENFAENHLAFFEDYLAALEDNKALASSRFQISRNRAEGLYSLKEAVVSRPRLTALKGQITGPFTLLTGLKDAHRRDAYYDPTIREVVVKALSLKASWQVMFLKECGYPVLVFIDEPALAGLGSSSFISISSDDIAQDLSEVINAIKKAGGLAGIHVCANTDWNFLLSLNLDILSFDAYGFFDRLVLCKEQVHAFLARGGIIAWGIVPTSEEEHILSETTESLAKLWQEQATMLTNEEWDLPKLLSQTLITPSCGTGSLTPELALKVLELTRGVSEVLRNNYAGILDSE